jgi:hypothetical protein
MPRYTQAQSVYPGKRRQTPILALSKLCNDAAEHVADARLALFAEDADAEMALGHLDEAIGCLKALLKESKELLRTEKATRRSA